MTDVASDGRVLVLSATWRQAHSEAAFVLRTLAGALSRHVAVDVLVPGDPDFTTADGLFDPRGGGRGSREGTWPDPGSTAWPFPKDDEDPFVLAVVDARDAGARGVLDRHAPDLPVVAVASGVEAADWHDGTVVSPSGLGLHVPVNPLATERPHNGFGFTDYVLVLTDRVAGHADPQSGGAGAEAAGGAGGAGDTEEDPTPLAAWLIARFPRLHVVVVEDAEASAWRNRSLQGTVHVDTRTDLWRLMAHARATVDLHPGPLVGRECVESLRLGTPVVAPATAEPLAGVGGIVAFDDVPGLLASVEALEDPHNRAALGSRGREEADARHGDAVAFTRRVGEVLAGLA